MTEEKAFMRAFCVRKESKGSRRSCQQPLWQDGDSWPEEQREGNREVHPGKSVPEVPREVYPGKSVPEVPFLLVFSVPLTAF